MRSLEIAGATSPTPDAAFLWALSIVVGILLLDLLGRASAANRLFGALAAQAHALGAQEPIVSLHYHGVLVFRSIHVSEDPMKGLEHCEIYVEIARRVGHGRFTEFVKCLT